MTSSTPPSVAELLDIGAAGYSSHALLPALEPRAAEEFERLARLTVAIRPLLREQQADTERRGYYSSQVHAYFQEHDFYKALLPRSLGGLEIGLPAFYLLIAEIARGCPSTAWCFGLPVGQTLMFCAHWDVDTQSEVLASAPDDYVLGPSSGQAVDVIVEPADGGYFVSGQWRYCSGAPYSNVFFARLNLPDVSDADSKVWAILPRSDYTVLDDWGAVIGMKGSGSNTIRVENAFVPRKRIVGSEWEQLIHGATPGYEHYGSSSLNGTFNGFNAGMLAAVAVGLGRAASDEYERIIRHSRLPYRSDGSVKADHDDWRRVLGLAMAKLDTAQAALVENGRLFEEYAHRSAEGVEDFTPIRTYRLFNSNNFIQEMVWEVLQDLVRTAGTTASADGQRMQRYFRDIWTAVSRTTQLQFFAAETTALHLVADTTTAEDSFFKPRLVD